VSWSYTSCQDEAKERRLAGNDYGHGKSRNKHKRPKHLDCHVADIAVQVDAGDKVHRTAHARLAKTLAKSQVLSRQCGRHSGANP
jgi:hypothetical protein